MQREPAFRCVGGYGPEKYKVKRRGKDCGLIEVLDNLCSELGGGGRTTHIGSPDLPSVDNIKRGRGDVVSNRVESKVPEHHGGRKDHGSRVSPIGSHDITSHMSAARLEKSVLRSDVAPWDDTRSTNESGTNVGNNGTIEVRHDHDVELLGLGDQLHGSVIDDHVIVRNSGRLVLLGDATEGVEE